MSSVKSSIGVATECIHAGKRPNTYGALCTPIYQSTTFSFQSTDDAAATFSMTRDIQEHFVYSRTSNPNTTVVERKIAALEHGTDAVAFGSGMGAIAGTFLSLANAGDHILCSNTLYSGTHHLLKSTLVRFGVEVTSVDTTDLSAVEKAIRPNTKIMYVETPANPTMEITDLAGIAEIAKKHNILSISDNTFASPYLCNPLDHGMDIVVHSCSKYICGHGDAVSGVVVTKDSSLAKKIRMEGLTHIGSVMAPHTASLLERGLKTLGLRMEQHCKNALAVAQWLEQQPWIAAVHYPYLPSDPGYTMAKKQIRGGSGVVSFEVAAGLEGGKALMNHLQLCTIAVSLGDCETLLEHPASMTHASVSKTEREAEGITDGLIRMSVGLENVEDIIADLEQASHYIDQ